MIIRYKTISQIKNHRNEKNPYDINEKGPIKIPTPQGGFKYANSFKETMYVNFNKNKATDERANCRQGDGFNHF
jgi:hypothetical protein